MDGENVAKRAKKQKHGAVVSFYCPTAQTVVEALAKNIVLRSFVSETGHLDPGDDFYTTPFAAVRIQYRKTVSSHIVYHVNKIRGPHYHARDDMGTFGQGIQFGENGLGDIRPGKVIEVVEFGVEPTDRVLMEVTCRLFDVEPPPDWEAKLASLVEEHRCKNPRGFADARAPINEQAWDPSGAIDAIRAQPRCACGNYARLKEAACNACHKVQNTQGT
jgi:hypothetical protein